MITQGQLAKATTEAWERATYVKVRDQNSVSRKLGEEKSERADNAKESTRKNKVLYHAFLGGKTEDIWNENGEAKKIPKRRPWLLHETLIVAMSTRNAR